MSRRKPPGKRVPNVVDPLEEALKKREALEKRVEDLRQQALGKGTIAPPFGAATVAKPVMKSRKRVSPLQRAALVAAIRRHFLLDAPEISFRAEPSDFDGLSDDEVEALLDRSAVSRLPKVSQRRLTDIAREIVNADYPATLSAAELVLRYVADVDAARNDVCAN